MNGTAEEGWSAERLLDVVGSRVLSQDKDIPYECWASEVELRRLIAHDYVSKYVLSGEETLEEGRGGFYVVTFTETGMDMLRLMAL